MQGRSLLARGPDREGYGETDHTVDRTHKLFLRAGAKRWKAILTLDPEGAGLRDEEWYDLSVDPGESRRGSPPPANAEAMRRVALERWKAARRLGAGAPAVNLTPEQRERLRALGYVSP